MTSAVLYNRVPTELKGRVEKYANERGVSITTAVTRLLEAGLRIQEDANTLASMQARAADMERRLAADAAELAGARAELDSLRQREQSTRNTSETLARRAQQTLGSCPKCRKPFTGLDLLVAGHCPHCNAGLSAVLAGAQFKTGLDEKEVLVLIGALSIAVLGAAYLQSRAAT